MSGASCFALGLGGIRLTIAPDDVTGFGVGTVTTNQALVVTAVGGIAPYTYSWTLDGDGTIFALSSTSSSSFFRRHDCVSAENYSATATCLVTDAVGQTGSVSGGVNIVGIS